MSTTTKDRRVHDSDARRGRVRAWQVVACWAMFGLVVASAWWFVDGPAAAQDDDDRAVARAGAFLWQRDCASCHGRQGQGTRWAPSIIEQGAAGVSLAITSGRMPLPADAVGRNEPSPRERQVPRGEVGYSPSEIDALVVHAGRILDGPAVPEVDLSTADRATGAVQFQHNCASCHTWSGRGGALTSGQVAVSLQAATPVEIVEAMRTGPGTMPVFDLGIFDEQAATDIAAYVDYLDDPATPLGHPLWFIGPVTEGLIAWVVGVVALLALVRWIGARTASVNSAVEPDAEAPDAVAPEVGVARD